MVSVRVSFPRVLDEARPVRGREFLRDSAPFRANLLCHITQQQQKLEEFGLIVVHRFVQFSCDRRFVSVPYFAYGTGGSSSTLPALPF